MIQHYYLVAPVAAGLAFIAWRMLLPRRFPGIPYNEESAKRITGDIPNIVAGIKATDEFAVALFIATTRRLGVPIAQCLFPGFRQPFVIVDDARESEDILLRRPREFDKSDLSLSLMSPLLPNGSVGMHTTDALRAQKRMWADVMSAQFLRTVAAPNLHGGILQLIDLWSLKASTVYLDQPFKIATDFSNATLEVIWRAIVGREAGTLQYEIAKLQCEIDGKSQEEIARLPEPKGRFLRPFVEYISDALTRNAASIAPGWAAKLETIKPRFRRIRSTVEREVSQAMRDAIARFERLESDKLDADELDTCMMDLVLRRHVATARRANKPVGDPSKDPNMIDEMLVMLIGGHESTATILTWFVRYMGENPHAQTELRTALKAAFPGDALPSAQEILDTSVPYLDATCEETLRLAMLSPCGLRQTTVDTEILGCPVPKGTQIFLSFDMEHTPYHIDESKRTEMYKTTIEKHGEGFKGPAGRDLTRFEPRRWLVADPDTGGDKFDTHALPALGFGGGYRGCFGRKLAVMNFHMVVVLLILKFEFLPLEPEYQPVKVKEGTFRMPDKAFAKMRVL